MNVAHNIPAVAGTIIRLPKFSHLIGSSVDDITCTFLLYFSSFNFFLITFAKGS